MSHKTISFISKNCKFAPIILFIFANFSLSHMAQVECQPIYLLHPVMHFLKSKENSKFGANTVSAWIQPHSWIEPHPKFRLVPWARTQTNSMKLMLCMFTFHLSMFKICICSPRTQYSVIQNLKFELNPTQEPVMKDRTPGLHSSGYGMQS